MIHLRSPRALFVFCVLAAIPACGRPDAPPTPPAAPARVEEADPRIAPMPRLVQRAATKPDLLRKYRDERAYDPLVKLLNDLARTDPALSADAKDREALVAELKELCKHLDMNVRVTALAAYARWDPENARAVVLNALRSDRPEEREMALRLLPQWKDAASARTAAAMIGAPGRESARAKEEALEEIGGPAAEQAAIGLLRDARNLSTRLTALSILDKLGGPDAAVALRAYARASDDQTVRNRAVAVAELIELRTGNWLLRNRAGWNSVPVSGAGARPVTSSR